MIEHRLSPFVAFKPSCQMGSDSDIYSVDRGLFSPNALTALAVLQFLRDFPIGQKTGITEIDSKIPFGTNRKRTGQLTLQGCENLSVDRNCNILGGMFLGWIGSCGIEAGATLGKAKVSSGDTDFMLAMYPDLADWFADQDSALPERSLYARGVVNNNSGDFLIIEVAAENEEDISQVCAEVALLKRIYRHGVRASIMWNNVGVRDNVVHTPENLDELAMHYLLFKERFQK